MIFWFTVNKNLSSILISFSKVMFCLLFHISLTGLSGDSNLLPITSHLVFEFGTSISLLFIAQPVSI